MDFRKQNLLEKKDPISFICFGGQDWWYHNHGHVDFQLMRQYAREHKVLYINSLVMQKPKFKEFNYFFEKFRRKSASILRGLRQVESNFWVYSPFSLPVFHIPVLSRLNELLIKIQVQLVASILKIQNPLVWVVCPTAGRIGLSMKKNRLLYLRTDKYESYPCVQSSVIMYYDELLKKHSDRTMYVNQELYAEEKETCRKAFYLDHGVEFDKFSRPAEPGSVPDDMRQIPRPIIGYFGAIDQHKLNISFLENMANLAPELSFVYVGKFSPEFKPILEKKNVWLLGMKDYAEIPSYGRQFDVAILPWRKNPWTQMANPIKLKEYLALGKPVVSTTAFSEIHNYKEVLYLADEPEEFIRKIHLALQEDTVEKKSVRQNRVRNSSWASKAEIALNELMI